MKKENEIRSEFKRVVVEANHGLPYKEALKKEKKVRVFGATCYTEYKPFPITIGRVMQALQNSELFLSQDPLSGDNMCEIKELLINQKTGEYESITLASIIWEISDDGKDLTDDDQVIQTIEKLLNLLKK